MNNHQLTLRAEQLRTLLREHPNEARACIELAEVTAQLGDYASAIDHDARAWTLAPDPKAILHVLGILVDTGKWLGAMTAFELVRDTARPDTALVLDLAATHVIRQLIGVFPPRGMRPEADTVIDRLVRDCRSYPVANQLSVLRTLIDLGRTAEATQVVAQLQAVEPSDRAQVCFLRGVLSERAGDVATAAARYEESLALDPNRVDAALNLMTVLLESPDSDSTRIGALIEMLDPAIRTDPGVRFNEALYLRRIGESDRATALLSSIASDRTTELGRLARQVLASC